MGNRDITMEYPMGWWSPPGMEDLTDCWTSDPGGKAPSVHVLEQWIGSSPLGSRWWGVLGVGLSSLRVLWIWRLPDPRGILGQWSGLFKSYPVPVELKQGLFPHLRHKVYLALSFRLGLLQDCPSSPLLTVGIMDGISSHGKKVVWFRNLGVSAVCRWPGSVGEHSLQPSVQGHGSQPEKGGLPSPCWKCDYLGVFDGSTNQGFTLVC